MEKATREAKQQTSWTDQTEFEEALRTFIERILDSHGFVSELEGFVGRGGRINSLAQTLLKCTVPRCSGHLSRQRVVGFESC